MVIRAGVDDRQMTSALGVNIQSVFAIAFVVGSALAAFGGVVGASQGNVASGQDGQWLLYSLVVVIIGGMGSLLGRGRRIAPVRARVLVRGVVPADDRERVLHEVRDRVHVRSAGPRARLPAAGAVREDRVSRLDPKTTVERVIGVVLLLVVRPRTAAVQRLLARRDPHPDAPTRNCAASLIFLSAYGGMISLAQTALMGIAGYMLGNMVTQRGSGGETKGSARAWDPTLALVLAIVITDVIGFVIRRARGRAASASTS